MGEYGIPGYMYEILWYVRVCDICDIGLCKRLGNTWVWDIWEIGICGGSGCVRDCDMW